MLIQSLPFAASTSKDSAEIFTKSQDLEVIFLAEMLGYSGLDGGNPDSFSAAKDESAFASLMRTEQAKVMVKAGGIGLAEQFYRSLQGTFSWRETGLAKLSVTPATRCCRAT